MTKTTSTPRTRKVRRISAGGKPSRGWELQRAGRKIRRADVRKLRIGETDAKLTTVGGLVSFNAFAREQGLPGELRRRFGHLKTGAGVVYPMGAQMQLLLDLSVAGGQRVFDLEMLAADPLFVHLGACAAYARVLAQWESAKPRSVSAEAAREAVKRLHCGAASLH